MQACGLGSHNANAFGCLEHETGLIQVTAEAVAEGEQEGLGGHGDVAAAKRIEQLGEQSRRSVGMGLGELLRARVVAVVTCAARLGVGVARQALAVTMNVHDAA